MEIRYNVTGEKRKELVKVISEATGERAVYRFMPTCNYDIGNYTVTKDGTLLFEDKEDSGAVLEAIQAAGFDGVAASDGSTEKEEKSTQDATDPGLVISLPQDGFDPDSLERLQKLVDSKAGLIKKALGADRLDIQISEGTVRFPWWDTLPEAEETSAYTAFIAALGKMAKEARRVTATEKAVDSEKYAFRGFLLRLGFIGADSKAHRKFLLKKLSGSAAFPNKEKADAFLAAQKAKHDAQKEVTA